MLQVNLIEKHKNTDIERECKEFAVAKLTKEHTKFKVGATIAFNAGYNNDIRYTSNIIGFDVDGNIYVMWDCYWSPIRDEERRNIQLVNS